MAVGRCYFSRAFLVLIQRTESARRSVGIHLPGVFGLVAGAIEPTFLERLWAPDTSAPGCKAISPRNIRPVRRLGHQPPAGTDSSRMRSLCPDSAETAESSARCAVPAPARR